MALATPSTALPNIPQQPGLSARMSSLGSGLDGLLLGHDAASLYADFCRLERLVTAGKALLAPRIAESGHWAERGFRSAAALLADLEGGPVGQAKRTLEAGQRLVELPGTEEALRGGRLSGPKLTEITQAASLDPASEGELLAGAESEALHVIKERCQRFRTTAATEDPVATLARIHDERHFTSWTDAEGAFCFSGRDSAERGAKLLARLAPVAQRLRDDRREAATETAKDRPKGAPSGARDSEAALRADALFLLVAGGRAGRTRRATTTESPTTDRTTLADPADLGSADDLITAPPPTTVIVRVDLAALKRGRALPGELCELDGHGPVPTEVIRSLVDDAFLALVFTEAGDIRAVSHLGRTVNAHLRTALALRDRHCVVPGCGVTYSLEIDHVHPLERGGRTELDNLALLCRHHHRLKTYEGWTLERTGPTDEDPGWSFTPLAPFGQEPDLGLDRPDPPPPPPDPPPPPPEAVLRA